MKIRGWGQAKRTQQLHRRAIVLDLWMKEGITAATEIVEILKKDFGIEVSHDTVSRDINDIKAQAVSRHSDEIKTEIVNKYNRLFEEAMNAWEKSIGEIKTIRNREGEGKDGPYFEKSETIEDSAGLAAYLTRAQTALDSLKAVYGLDAKKEISLKVEQEMDSMVEFLEKVLPEKTFDEVIGALESYSE